MANDKNFTQIPNKVLEALIAYHLPGNEMKCLLLIMRKTYGWHKSSDNIAISQFRENTGILDPNVKRSLNSLAAKKIIKVINNDNKRAKSYRINERIEAWKNQKGKRLQNSLSRLIMEVSNNDNENIIENDPYKINNINKKTKESRPHLQTIKNEVGTNRHCGNHKLSDHDDKRREKELLEAIRMLDQRLKDAKKRR